ncbi:DNA repair protein REV1 [Ophiophagus hannah]|uniref:DNA repair protein REV1 n=1 Tax=Ophiophagus hannah TaxID=8665 RepID=V8NTY0_OPHHA|nr:DNA repair protein REV1 [Ophiophagus hannah]
MKQGGWRKRASDRDGWGTWGGYMPAKIQKLENQFHSEAALQHHKDEKSSSIFSGVAIFVNGFTDPSADELRRLMMLHGGQYHMYYSRSKTTHIIATNLPNAKIKELKGEKIVRPDWIIDSIKAGRLLSYIPYQLYTKQTSIQKGLWFNTICKPEDSIPGPSNISVGLNRVNSLVKKHEGENEMKTNGVSKSKKEAETTRFLELEQTLSRSKQNGIYQKDNFSIFNGHSHNSNSALKIQEGLLHFDKSVISRLSPVHEELKESTDFRDCSTQHLQQSNRNTELLRNVHRTMSNSSFSSLHSNIKINGAHHYNVQGPSSTKSTTSVPAPSKEDYSPLSKPSNGNFISDFYSRSRLHHISTWKCEFTEFINTLQKQNNANFPGREKLKKMKAGQSTTNKADLDSTSFLNSAKHQCCIMHVDMDCFFVSVGVRNRPDLKGKPVAVTSNRGSGKAVLRPGTNPQLERQYYQNKLLKGRTEIDDTDSTDDDTQDSAELSKSDFDISVSSMAEIASCSYEARQAGIKNGMFFGQAKQLCPNLEAVPYDFHAYKEVAQTMYKTLASYTHNIEAVSCDEALVDTTEILAETGLTSDELANVIRAEIKNKTKCPASIGIGVGRTMESKLSSMGVKTCGDLQCITMSKLQKEFGPKTGQMLYRFCRGLDDRPIQREKTRKSVSAEINYGIRFSQAKEAEAFLLSLSEEIQRRLEAAGMKGRRLTLKVMIRKAGAPVEPAKFGGHGICDSVARTVTLNHATDNGKVIGKEILNMFHTMKLNISDMRGVGIQVHQLVSVNKTTAMSSSNTSLPSGFLPGGADSIIDLLQVSKGVKKSTNKEECKEVFLAAVDVEISSASKACTDLSSEATNLHHVISKSEPSTSLNGLYPPISIKSRLNLSIEVPSASQLDKSVLEALPSDLREQIEHAYSLQLIDAHDNSKKEPINGYNINFPSQPGGTVLLQMPDLKESSNNAGINIIALPAFSQVDPDVFAALPSELQEELRQAYDQRQNHVENVLQQSNAIASKNPVTKSKKRTRKKIQVSPVKTNHSPFKNKRLGNPAKNMVVSVGSPQKLIDNFLKQEKAISDNPQMEEVQAVTNPSSPSISQPLSSTTIWPQAPNLAGAIEFNDVKALLKEWITTISDPMEEDILQVVKYCTDLIEEKDLEKLDLVIKYMKRLMQQSVESVWNMAFDFILDNVQVVLQQTYGSTLKII